MTDRPGVAVLGAGRMGQGLALALLRGGCHVRLYARTEREVVQGPEVVFGDLGRATAGVDAIILAVPDDSVTAMAQELKDSGAVSSTQVVVHLSGSRDRSALKSLDRAALGLGSFWPVQTVPDPGIAPERFAGAYAGLEGDPAAIAIGERLARALGMTPVTVPSAGKILAHAGAVVAGNYPVVLLGLAERLAEQAGVAPALAGEIYLPLVRAAVENAAALGAGAALTGPLRRGDVQTVKAHLKALPASERPAYRALGLQALALIESDGSPPPNAKELKKLLKGSR